MKGDITRDTFRPKRHYSSVRMQQGRVQLDADWNEQADIQTHLRAMADRDLIGPCGGPKGADASGKPLAGFRIQANAQKNDLLISGGRYYVQGILCENESDVRFTEQPDRNAQQAKTALKQETLPTQAGAYLAYLEAWERHVTAVEDPSIREKALGGPDTATRTVTAWQVKLERLGPSGTVKSCDDFGLDWRPGGSVDRGRLAARAEPSTGDAENPCVIPAGAGYRRVENQLYRVEIHDSGSAGTGGATFKWSRDNGSVVARWKSSSGNDLTIGEEGRDQALSFAGGQWIELTDDTRELWGEPGVLVQLKKVEGPVLTIDPTTISDPQGAAAVAHTRFPRNPKIRRWESAGPLKVRVPGANKGWLPLEDGVEVHFKKNQTYTTGDYWLIPARTAIGDVLWPKQGNKPRFEPRHGVDRRYCPLGLLEVDANLKLTVVDDCRKIFPPATAIAAEDVSFDDTVCGSEVAGAETVQEAIDALCGSRKDGCSLVVLPIAGWEKTLDQIADGQDAHICFQIGTYKLDKSYTLKNKGNLKLTGCGPGTRIVAAKAEAALRFEHCKSVAVRDLHAKSGALGSRQAGKKGLNGTLTFCACPSVDLDAVSLECAAGARRQASCVTIIDSCDPPATGTRTVSPITARIRRSTFAIGHLQVGVLVVNAARARIEDNVLRVVKKPKSLTFGRLMENKTLRAAARGTLVANPTFEKKAAAPAANVVTVKSGERTVSFVTDKSMVGEWGKVIKKIPPAGFLNSDNALLHHVRKIADRAILNDGAIGDVRVFRPWFRRIAKSNPAVASQAIVVGGRVARDVQIRDNTITGALQGIRLGVSHRESKRGTADRAGAVLITGNQIEILLPVIRLERFGIFIGNCDSLVIENNYLKVRRLKGADQHLEGMRIYGHLGKRVIVRQNHVEGTVKYGILIYPLNAKQHRKPQWLVADNVASVSAPSSVRQSHNFAS